MVVTITSKRQVTFPKRVMDQLHLHAGDRLTLSETSDGVLMRPTRFDSEGLAPLKAKIDQSLPVPDYDKIRHASLDPKLRD
jgi:AbrB family looped-hinge helix DNA binding protein